jgi:hypothetical protein
MRTFTYRFTDHRLDFQASYFLNDNNAQEYLLLMEIHLSFYGKSVKLKNRGQVATAIEEQTAKLPSDLFLWAASGSMAASHMKNLC